MNEVLTEMKSFGSRVGRPFLLVVIIGLIIRFVLMPLTFNADPYYWSIVADMINADNGLYDTLGYSYTPVWGYFLSALTFIGTLFGITHYSSVVPFFIPYTNAESTYEFITTMEFDAMLKVSLIIVDVIVAFLIYYAVDEILNDRKKAAIAAGIWFLCPLTIIESSVHGMFDNISALFLVLTLIFMYKKKYLVGGFVYAFAVLTKYFPIFFIFMIVAIVLRNEGFDRNGFKKTMTGVGGFLLGFVLIYLPIFATGTFWNSMWFLTSRLGIETDTLNSVLPAPVLLLIAAAAIAAVAILWYFLKDRITAKVRAFRDMDPKVRDRKMIKFCVIAIAVFFVLIAALAIHTALQSDLPAKDLQNNLIMKGIMFITLVSIIIQIFIAYRYIFTTNHDLNSTVTALMLTACTIFLWPATPQYVIVIIPILALYVAVSDRKFLVPVIVFGTVTMLSQLASGNISMLYTLSAYTPLIDEVTIKSLLDAFLVSNADLMSAIKMAVGPIAYLTLINMILYWLKKNNWGRLNEQ